MTNIEINTNLFPGLSNGVQARWVPVFFHPITGSYERLVVGVAAYNSDGYHLEWANELQRLVCFYGEDAAAAVSAIEIAGAYLERDLAVRASEALSKPDPAVTGISFGEEREAEGKSLRAIAISWIVALSSLYSADSESGKTLSTEVVESNLLTSQGTSDRLPFMVCDFITSRNDAFSKFFSADLRDGKPRRMKGSSHKVVIDFSGSKLVANFGTLKAGSLTGSVNLIKRRLWDLKVERDREPDNKHFARNHEMILHKPSKDDPQVTEKQQSNLEEAFCELEEQADQEQLRLRALSSVQLIGKHILEAEAA